MTATWEGAQPLVALGKRWERKRKPREFDRTITHAEQCAVRRAIEKSTAIDMNINQRRAVMKWANLWFKHRSSVDFLSPGYERFAKMLKIGERTVIKIVAWAERHGFVVRIGGGLGRGNKTQWGVSIKRIMEVLAPNFAASNGEERVTSDGEILACKKVKVEASLYKNTHRGLFSKQPYRSPAELFHAGRWTTVRFLQGLIERLALGYSPRPRPTPPWTPQPQANGGIR